jgi:S-(hydroxymethyl)glutathione dehydrogenase / alcohol dehydrogenase
VRALTAGRGADYVFEAVGLPSLQEQCLAAARPGGTVVLSGLAPMGSGTNLPGALLVRQEKTVMGAYYGTVDPGVDFVRYARLYMEGALPLDRLVSKRYPLEGIGKAFEEMLSGATRRGVLMMDS